MKKKTNWRIILEYISKKTIGELITRKELKDLFEENICVDPSRCLLTKFGVLELFKSGTYIKKRNIKPTWSMFKLKDIAESSWKRWYIKLD